MRGFKVSKLTHELTVQRTAKTLKASLTNPLLGLIATVIWAGIGSPALAFEINVNCGGGGYTTVGGRHYLADQPYSPGLGYGYVDGNAGSTADPIDATDDDALYQTERWGVSEYKFDVPDATYNVRLQFCEISHTSDGSRVFDVFIEGKKVWSNLDVFSLVSHDKALDLIFSFIHVNDGQINITTQSHTGATQFAGICAWDADPRDIGMSDDAFLDMYERKIFNWFYNMGVAPYYLCPDGSSYDDQGHGTENCNISGLGFELVVLPIGVKRGWISYEEAYERCKGILNAVNLMSRDEFNTRMHYVYKLEPWRDWWFSGTPPPRERDLWDNGNLFMGVVFAAQYFKGTPLEILARRLYEEVNWNKWDFTYLGYNEGLTAVIMGASSPTYPLPNPYDSWNNQTPDYHNSLYYFHWFANYADFRNIVDGRDRNAFNIVREATAFHRDCCISDWTDSPDEFQTYDYDSWGLTAVPTCSGYKQLRACSGLEANDSGSICPITIAASLPFLPAECLNAMKHLYWRFYQRGWPSYMPPIMADYGFLSLYNIGTAWNTNRPCAQTYVICFDQGAQILGIENYHSGFVWEYFMKSEDIIRGLYKMGFTGTGVTQPPFTFETNIAEGKTAFASSSKGSEFAPDRAIDHKMITRWAASPSRLEWIAIDLKADYLIQRVRILWHDAYATDFSLQFSQDASHWYTYYSTSQGDGGVDNILVGSKLYARYMRVCCRAPATTEGYSVREIEVSGKNLAQDKPTVASSSENEKFLPLCATDGHFTSRWSSQFSDPQWISVDLGSIHNIDHIILHWENAYARTYKVQVSISGANWSDVFSTAEGDGGVDDITFSPVDTRFVRIWCTERGTPYGYSLWEIEVFPMSENFLCMNNLWILY